MTNVALNEELERLRAANAELQAKVNRRLRWRGAGSGLLLTLGCGLAVLSLLALWLRGTLLNTDRYVSTVTPIAANPAVQDAVAARLETAIYSRVDFASLAQQVLPERADVLAPAIERGAQSVISDRIRDFTRSPRFQELWVQANQRAHTRVVELLEGGRSKRLVLDDDTLYLDLSPIIARVKAALQQRGLDRIAAAIPPSVDGRITLVKSSAFGDAQTGVRALKATAIILPVLALLCLIGSVWLARDRRRGLLRAAIGVAFAMLLLIAALAVGRSAYLSAIDQNVLPRDAASAIFDALVALLRHGVRIVVVAAVVIALLSFLFGLPLRHLAMKLWTDSRRTWVAAHQRVLMIVVGALGMVVLLVASPLTGRIVLVDLLVVGVLLGVIALLGLEPREAVADQLDADDQHQDRHDHGVVGGHP
jgi:hypothetical protein